MALAFEGWRSLPRSYRQYKLFQAADGKLWLELWWIIAM